MDGSRPERALPQISDRTATIAGAAGVVLAILATASARAILARRRLTKALGASVRDVEASRRRIASAGAAERRRIERDLHDGAQQQLVTLRVKLELLSEEIARDPERGAELVRELAPRIDSVIEEVRALASGIYPSLLADAGLVEALRAAARRNDVAATVSADGVGAYPADIETAVYFCCLEALQNADKHAHCSAIAIDLAAENGDLRFEIRDDGVGFDPTAGETGAGLMNMRDRLAALGGEVSVISIRGQGTVVRGRVTTA